MLATASPNGKLQNSLSFHLGYGNYIEYYASQCYSWNQGIMLKIMLSWINDYAPNYA